MQIEDPTPLPCSSNPNLQLKVPDWKEWAYTDGSCHVKDGKQVIGAGVFHPRTKSKHLVDPSGAGITNSIPRAELAGIAAAIENGYTHIATDSLSSLFQIRKQLMYPEKHRHHLQEDVLKTIATRISASENKIHFYKVKAHAGIAGNECADALANHQAYLSDQEQADTGIPLAGPNGNPFYDIHWLAHKRPEQQNTHDNPTSNPTYLSNLHDNLKSHMHSRHKLGYANSKTGYYTYYQDLLPIVDKKISNAFWNMKGISFPAKRNIFQYRTGTLNNQKLAVRHKRSTNPQCPLCHHTDSALHILSGCQHATISNMITERHNIASRHIIKALSKGALGACIVSVDAGSEDRLLSQNLHLPEDVSMRYVPKWLFKRGLSDREKQDSSRPDAILVTNKPIRPTPSNTQMALRSGTVLNRNIRTTNASSPKDIPENERVIHLVEIKYCEDTRPGHQLEAANEQHKKLCDRQLKGKNIVLHTILLGVGGSVYIPHTLKHFIDLGLDPQRSEKLAYTLHEHSVQYAYKLTSTRRAIEKNSASQNPPEPH